MNTQNLSTLKIHKLTQAQYDRELAAGNIDVNALYLTPDNKKFTTITIPAGRMKGDVDGNGLINTADLQKMLPVVNKTLGDNTVITLAANIVDTKSDKPPMHNIQVNDIQAIVNHNGKKKLIDPAALAAAHSTYNSYYQ